VSRRRRVWCEFLAPEELGSDATVRLLRRFELEPIIALPPTAETPRMADALRRLSRGGVPFGIWPLLSDEDGYWPSEDNAPAFEQRMQAVLQFVGAAGAELRTVAIDLEPPLGITKKLMHGALWKRGAFLVRGIAELGVREEVRRRSIEVMARVARMLHERKLETIAAVLPPVVLDLFARDDLWQGVFRTPVTAPHWSVLSPMLYTTLLRRMLPPPSALSARALLSETARMLVDGVGAERASLSVGLVTTGKLGDEPAYASPRELALDVAAARAAGVNDIALFSLEGVLHRGTPESWLVPFDSASSISPPPILSRPLGAVMRSFAVALGTGRALLR
jgi:hypothetical protein